jgi:tRNA U34 2-thiouridine synthase MnmA/TrmU
MPFSVKDDFYINRSNYNNMKDMKVEATLAITFAIAEGSYQTAEDIAFSWIDLDHFCNKLGKAHIVENFLKEYWKFAYQSVDRMLLKEVKK